MNIHLEMPVRDVFEYMRRLREYGRVSEADALEDTLVDETEIALGRRENAEKEISSLQFELEEVRRYQQHLLPFDYRGFDTLYDACGELCGQRNEILLDDEILVQDSDIFWKVVYKGEDIDSGGFKWYTVIGQKVKAKSVPPYIVIKDFEGKDNFD